MNCPTCAATPDMCCCNSTRSPKEATSTADAADFLFAVAQAQGAGVLTVKDGWVLMFSRDKIRQIYEASLDQEYVAIHVQSSGKLEASGALKKN